MDAPEADELSPAAKRRRLDAGEERSLIGTEQKDKPASEAGDLERDKEQADDKSGSEDAPQDEAMSIPEADTSLSRVEDDEDEWNAVYDDLEWDGVLEMEEAGTAARAIFSPNQARSQAAPHQPSSSPLKAGVVVNNAVEARETVNASQQPIPSSQHSPSGQDEEEEARIRAHEEALLAKYKNLDYLTKFNDLQSAFNSPAQGGNSAAFSSAGFTSVRGKSLKPSDEALAKASRFAQLSPEAASDKGEGSSTSDALALSAETPLVQRSRSALPFPNHVQSTSREASAPPTVSRFSRPSEVQPLRPLRYGPKKGHSLLPNRVPTAVHQGITTLEAVPFPVINNIPSGFTSGSGKRVVMPSKEQAEKHVRTLEGNEQEEATNVETAGQLSSSPSEGYPGLSFAGGGTFKMPSKALLDKEKDKMERTVSQSVNHVDMQPSSDAQSTKFAGLQSASGKAISIPSEEAVNKVVDSLDSGRKGVPTASFGGFATGSGKPVVPPTEEQIRVATTKLDNPEINAVPIHSPSHALGGRQSFTGLTSGGGKAIAGPSAEAVAASNSRLSMDQDAMAVDKAATTPARPALASKAANIMRAHTPGMTPGGSSAKPFLPPTSALSKSSKVPVALPSTPGRPGGSQLSSTQQPRRLNLEMTPRNTPKSALNRSTFKTPFKNGQRPDAQMLKKLKEDSNSKMVNPGRNVDVVASQVASTPKQSQAARNNAEHRLVKNSVFDMYSEHRFRFG